LSKFDDLKELTMRRKNIEICKGMGVARASVEKSIDRLIKCFASSGKSYRYVEMSRILAGAIPGELIGVSDFREELKLEIKNKILDYGLLMVEIPVVDDLIIYENKDLTKTIKRNIVIFAIVTIIALIGLSYIIYKGLYVIFDERIISSMLSIAISATILLIVKEVLIGGYGN